MSRIQFTIHSLYNVDIDSDRDGIPSIQFQRKQSSPQGITQPENSLTIQKTSQGVLTKEGFLFEKNNILTFNLTQRIDSMEFEVKVLMEGDDYPTWYDGVGVISHLSGQGEEGCTCDLYSSDSEDIVVGEMLYSWSCLKSESNVIEDLDATYSRLKEGMSGDYSEISDRPSSRRYNYQDPLNEDDDSILDLIETADRDKDKFEVTESRQREGTMATDFSQTFDETQFKQNQKPKLPVAVPEKMQEEVNYEDDHEEENYEDAFEVAPPLERTSSPSLPGGNSKSKTKKPKWGKFSEYLSLIGIGVQEDIARAKASETFISITLKIHSVMYSPPSCIDSTNQTQTSSNIKLSIQPLPGTGTVIRSKICELNEQIPNGYTYDYEMQTVSLRMSIAEINSCGYKQGACPALTMEFSTSKFLSSGSLYFPLLTQETPGKLILLHTSPVNSSSSEMPPHESGKATILFEVISEASTKTKAILPQNLDRNGHEVVARPVNLSIDLIGIIGKALKDIQSCSVEISLSCSGLSDRTESKKAVSKKSFEYKFHSTLCSYFPLLDILQLRILSSQPQQDQKAREIGLITVPISILLRNGGKLHGPLQAYSIVRPTQRGVNKIEMKQIAMVLSLSAEPSDEDVLFNQDFTLSKHFSAPLLNEPIDDDDGLNEKDLNLVDMDLTQQTKNQNDSLFCPKFFNPVKSIAGVLQICVHGFIPRLGTSSLSNLDQLSIEFNLPNSSTTIERSETVRLTRYDQLNTEEEPRYCALWTKEFTIPIVWSLQQRFVGYLLGTLITSSTKSGRNQEEVDRRKHTFGYLSLDLSSFVTMDSGKTNGYSVVAALPVVNAVCSLEDYHDCLGYVMLGMYFDSSHSEKKSRCLVPKPSQVMIPKNQSIAWEGDQRSGNQKGKPPTSAPSQQILPTSVLTISPLRKQCIERWKEFCDEVLYHSQLMQQNQQEGGQDDFLEKEDIVPLNISFSDIEAVAGPLRQLTAQETITLFVSSNNELISTEGYVNFENGKISLQVSDLSIPLVLRGNVSILLLFKLVRNIDSAVLGVAQIILPRELVVTGKPTNIALPLRNSSGLKIAVAMFGCHFSSYSLTSMVRSTEDKISSPHSDFNLRVTILEGNLTDGGNGGSACWTSVMEPYFECYLVNLFSKSGGTSQNGSVSDDLPLPISQDEIFKTISVDTASGQWNVSMSIPIPIKVFSDATSGGNNSFWSLVIKCRDSIRIGHPVIAFSQISLPSSLLIKERPIDQWVQLTSTKLKSQHSSTSVYEPAAGDDHPPSRSHSQESRLHLKISRVNKQLPLNYANDMNPVKFPGVGQVILWYHSIREGDSVLSKTLPSQDILSSEVNVELICSGPESYLDEGMREDIADLPSSSPQLIIFRQQRIETHRSLYVDNHLANVLSGNIEIPGGKSLINLRLMTRTDHAPLLTSISTMEALPKSCQDLETTPQFQLSMEIPIQEVLLRPQQITTRSTMSKVRLGRLKIGTVFVPYLAGYLYIFHSQLVIHETIRNKFESKSTKKGVLRFSMGGLGNCFTPIFTMNCEMNHGSKSQVMEGEEMEEDIQSQFPSTTPRRAHSQSPTLPSGFQKSKNQSFRRNHNLSIQTPNHATKQPPQSKANKLRNMVANNQRSPSPRFLKEARDSASSSSPSLPFIEINTFDIFQSVIQSSKFDDIFCLKICLFDLDSVGRQYCLGIGYLQTASIYFQALRLLFSKSSSAFEIPSTMNSYVELHDPIRTNLIVATVTIKLKFEVSSIPVEIINYLKSFKQFYQSAAASAAAGNPYSAPLLLYGRAELGLKQAFQVADKSGSGGISYSELVAVFERIQGQIQMKGKSVKKAIMSGEEVIGLDDSIQSLLIQLMKIVNGKRQDRELDGRSSPGEYQREAGQISNSDITQLFRLMDLDGDGDISWWEWRQVLENTSIVTILQEFQVLQANAAPAAGTAAVSNGMIDLLDPLLITLEAAHGYLISQNDGVLISKPKKYSPENNFLNAQEPLDERTRLKSEVYELKQKTKSLQQRLHSAINNERVEGDPGVSSSPHPFSPPREGRQVTELLNLVETERAQRMKLEDELARMVSNSEAMNRTQSELQLETENKKRKLQLETEKLRYEVICTFLSRKRQENSLKILRRFLLKFKSYLVHKKTSSKELFLNRTLYSMILRKQYQQLIRRRRRAAIRIQSLVRKKLSCIRIQKMKRSFENILQLIQLRRLRNDAMAILYDLKVQKKKEKMATMIAATWRGVNIRRLYHLQIFRVIKIQSCIRRLLARVRYSLEVKKITMAIRIQSIFRKYRHKRTTENIRKRKIAATRSIQTAYRHYKKRMFFLRICVKVLKYVSKQRQNQLERDLEQQEREKLERERQEQERQERERQEREREELLRHHAIFVIVRFLRKWKGRKARRRLVFSIIQLQRLYRRILQKRLEEAQKAIPTDISLLELDSPPEFVDCPKGYWVIRERDPTREGYIEKIRPKGRLLYVNFNQGDGNIFLTPVPYDEPNLQWFREVPMSHELPFVSDFDDPVDLVRLDQTPELPLTPGYWFIRGGRSEIQYFVDNVDVTTRLLSTRFRNQDDHVLAEQISYDEKGLVWYREKSISMHSHESEETVIVLDDPPPIGKAPGHWVSVDEESPNGLVDKVNLTTRRMVVIYEDGNHEVPYDQPGLIWMK